MKLDVKNLSFCYRASSPVLKDVSVHAKEGELTVIIGPNGAGKSTLLKCMARSEKTREAVFLDDRDIDRISGEELKDSLAYLPQDSIGHVGLTVFEAVLLGRVKQSSWKVSDEDLEAVSETLGLLKIDDLGARYLCELSGGQRQVVSLAQSIISDPRILMLDEPSNNLDMRNELKILELVQRITHNKSITSIMTLHSLSMAARFADRIILLCKGEVLAQGAPAEVLTPSLIKHAFSVEAEVLYRNGKIYVFPENAN